MLTHILHNFPALCAFLDQLHLELSKPQHQHILNLADALLTCADTKTLAALQRQFIAVADAFNAMTTDRPYRRAKTHEEAMAELGRCAGTQLDPQVVEAFMKLMGEE